jgi:hypothetical protein
MNNHELKQSMQILGLTQADLAAHLGVASRSVRRWQMGEQPIPQWVQEIVAVWTQLHERKLPWGADLESIWYGDTDQIDRHMEHDKALAAILGRVAIRGGPSVPWRINVAAMTATLGKITVRFYKLKSGSFSLASYRRGDDIPADAFRDRHMIEDAVASFFNAWKRVEHQ